jgi:hypothetical protein
MGNYISSNTGSSGVANAPPSLWDMITKLVTEYIFSKIEKDEYLRQHLIESMHFIIHRNNTPAITFEPLPSRLSEENEERQPKNSLRIVEEEESIESVSESDEEEEIESELIAYSLYGWISNYSKTYNKNGESINYNFTTS